MPDAVDEPARTSRDGVVREVAAVAAQAAIIRNFLANWARGCGMPAELVEDLTLAAYEAMANVVEHAYPDGAEGTMTIAAHREPGAITVTVHDTGRWRDGGGRPDGGRGIPIIRAVVPEASITRRVDWVVSSSARQLAVEEPGQ
jgi:serine/threonine-protein kinase RsbW